MSFKNGVLEGSRLDFGKVWDAPGQDLEGPGPIFGLFMEDLWLPRLGTPADNCGQALLPSSVRPPHLTTQLDKCGAVFLPWGSFL